jgi:hypothetical protein
MHYHKIPAVYKRESVKPHKIIEGEYATPELEFLRDCEWVFTEKIDGTNIRIMWDGHAVHFGGRTDNAQIPTKLLDRLTQLFMSDANEQMFEQVFGEKEVTLFGEGYGANIQKGGGNYSLIPDFILFDVNVGGIFLQRENMIEFAQEFDIDYVPVRATGSLEEGVHQVKQGIQSVFGPFEAEGLVGKPEVDLYDRQGNRIIVKIKAKDFQ